MFNVDAVAELGRSGRQGVCIPKHLIVDFLSACQAAGKRWSSGISTLDDRRIKELEAYAPVTIHIHPDNTMSWGTRTEDDMHNLTPIEPLMVSDFFVDIHSLRNDLTILLRGEETNV